MDQRYIGKPVLRLEDQALLTGTAQFIDDIQIPGLLEAAFVRSPHPHALIRSVDVSAALALPGVHAIFGYDDLRSVLTSDMIPTDRAGGDRFPVTTWPVVVPKDETCFAGEPIAIVVADTRYNRRRRGVTRRGRL